MRLFDALTAQRRFVYLVVALASAAGIWAGLQLPSAIYPELKFPRITIVATGSALGARQMVFAVTRPIEEAVSIVPGVVRVRTRSIRGEAEVNMFFSPNTDMPLALQQVQARVNQVRGDLPAGLELEVERLTPSLFPILSYNLEGGDPATLFDIARYQVKPVLSRIPGVGRVDVSGTDVREVEVVADPARLAGLGMSYDDLAAAIRRALPVAALGRVSQDYRQYLVVTDQEAHAVEDVGAVVLPGGLRVRDVATVTLGTEDHVRVIAANGRPAALINVTRQPGGNTVAIADSIAAVVATIAPQLPAGVRLTPLYDQASLVREALGSVRDAMLIGAALAVLVLLAFLGHARITAVSASAIPLTMMITVFVMRLAGQTFNLMTLGAMAIAIGLVIDDAVVVTENIARHLALGAGRRDAIREALQELIWPVTTSTVTTVVVFLPLGLLEGVVGQFFIALSVTLTIAVLVSLVLALTVIPLLSEQFLSPHEVERGAGPGALFARISASLDGLSAWYADSLARTLPRPRAVVAAALALVALGIVAQRFVGTAFLPEMDEGAFVLDYWTPGGTSLAESDRMVRQAERLLAEIPEVAGTSRRLGAELGLFATQQNRGDIVVRLVPRSKRSRSSFQVIDDARDRIQRSVPRLRIEFVQILSDVINDLAGAAKPVEIKLFGEQLEPLEGYARTLAPRIAAVEGVEDLYDGVSEPAPEMKLRVREAEAARAGLDPEQVDAAVSGALLGVDAGEVRREDRAIRVRVRAPDSVRFDPQRLAALPVVGTARRAVPLGALATVTPAETRAELLRENQQQMIAITSDVSDRALGSVMRDVRDVLAAVPPPPGIRVEIGGQYANQQEAFRALLIVLALAAVSVIAVMVLQFQSFVEPLVIVTAAPVSFVGAVALLLLTGTPLNVSSLMGLILLVGLIVKNGIILLDFTRRRMRLDGLPLERAIVDAARVRLRPILMTTLCTLFGL
ncbi:MAG TPA: efflux RND transporter permease subunit, partial [Gemmatimonadaceae bacterium]|nr:efflux RND transporter permease subunit [Gemmatimonadaceae bacterium]